MKVAYVTVLDADDPTTWSGLNRSIADCLRAQGLDLTLIGPLFDSRHAFLSKVKSRLRQLSGNGRHLWTRDHALLRFYGRRLQERLAGVNFDLIFSPATEPLAFLPTDIRQPVVVWTDAPMGAMIDYYPWYTGIAPSCLEAAKITDTTVLRRAALVCYTSSWAAEAAVHHHGVSPEKIALVPFGANVDNAVSEDDISALVASRLAPPWRLLFVGVDWHRKGGAKAVALVEELNRHGHPAVLDIVGCIPPGPMPACVQLHGFLSRREPAGREALTALFRRASFFVLPTLADATPVVFCEALAHALPCFGTRTGGVPSVIWEGDTGHLFAPDAPPAEWAARIIACADPFRYEAMSRAARFDSATRLNWHAAGARLKSLLSGLLPGRMHASHRVSSVA